MFKVGDYLWYKHVDSMYPLIITITKINGDSLEGDILTKKLSFKGVPMHHIKKHGIVMSEIEVLLYV